MYTRRRSGEELRLRSDKCTVLSVECKMVQVISELSLQNVVIAQRKGKIKVYTVEKNIHVSYKGHAVEYVAFNTVALKACISEREAGIHPFTPSP